MAASTSVVGEILKTVYSDVVYDLVNTRHDMLGSIRKTFDADGEKQVMIHRTGGNASMRFQAEGGTLMTARSQLWQNSEITPKEWWGTIKITQRLISQSKKNKGSFVRGLESELKYFGDDAHKFWEVRLMGDGSGSLATVRGSAADGGGVGPQIHIDVWDARKFIVGELIEVWGASGADTTTEEARDAGAALQTIKDSGASSDSEIGSTVTLNRIANVAAHASDSTLATITLTDDADFGSGVTALDADGDVIAVAGTRASSARYDIMGLDGIVRDRDAYIDGNFQGINCIKTAQGAADTTGVSKWASQMFSNGGTLRPPTERVFQRAMDAVEIHANSQRINKWIMGYGARLEWAVGQQSVRRHVNTKSLSGAQGGGFSENTTSGDYVEYGNVPMVPNRFCRPDVIYGTVWEDIEMYYWARQQWWDDDGSVIRRAPGRTTEYEAENFAIAEVAVGNRNAHARIEDVEHNEAQLL